MLTADSDFSIPTDGGAGPFASTGALHDPVAGRHAGGSHRALALGLPVASDPPGRRQVLALGPWRPPSRAHACDSDFKFLTSAQPILPYDTSTCAARCAWAIARRTTSCSESAARPGPARAARAGPAAPARVYGLRVV